MRSRAGLALCPEERKSEGLIADLSVGRTSSSLSRPVPVSSRTFRSGINNRLRSASCAIGNQDDGHRDTCRTALGWKPAEGLLARWLATNPRLLILDEPTRGIDVAAKQEIMNEIVTLARDGMAVMFISAEIEEVVNISDRVIVMRDRGKAGELPRGCGEHAVYDLIARH